MKLPDHIVYQKVSPCALDFFSIYMYVFFNLMLCHGKRGFSVNFQFLLISHSVFVKISWNFKLFNQSFTMCNCFLSMQNYATGKGCLMSFTLGFFYSQSKRFPISLRQFKIYVADRKPQTIISFFLVYT